MPLSILLTIGTPDATMQALAQHTSRGVASLRLPGETLTDAYARITGTIGAMLSDGLAPDTIVNRLGN